MRPLRLRKIKRMRGEGGQSLLETAIALPLMMTLVFNALNVGYFWSMVLILSAVPRHGVEFATQGGQALANASFATAPSNSTISTLVYSNLASTVKSSTTATVEVCTTTTVSGGSTSCYPSATFSPAASADPEPTLFVLRRVAIKYCVKPLIPGGVFSTVLPTGQSAGCTSGYVGMTRQVSMRSLY